MHSYIGLSVQFLFLSKWTDEEEAVPFKASFAISVIPVQLERINEHPDVKFLDVLHISLRTELFCCHFLLPAPCSEQLMMSCRQHNYPGASPTLFFFCIFVCWRQCNMFIVHYLQNIIDIIIRVLFVYLFFLRQCNAVLVSANYVVTWTRSFRLVADSN